MEKIRNLKNRLKSNGSGLNSKPISYLSCVWNEIYEYIDGITVRIVPISYKFPANVSMYINIDAGYFGLDPKIVEQYATFYEDHLLRFFNESFADIIEQYTVDNKIERLLSKIQIEKPDSRVIRRSGLVYNSEERYFTLKLFVLFPTGSGISILGIRMAKMITDIMRVAEESTYLLDRKELDNSLVVYKKQRAIRKYCADNGIVAFVADGSCLPRKDNSDKPLEGAIPFSSPESLRCEISTEDGLIMGMGVPKGITVITGAGFSGKTTLLEAIQEGIYDHIPGDGREFVVAEKSLVVTNAEDGRYVANENISMFFSDMPFQNVCDFSTKHASGSVSQASNIVEAVLGGSKLLTIDEDKSATNFMIRDEIMRHVVKNEVITPFTDRITDVSKVKGVSVILVIGGSGEYLKIADTVIMMDRYVAEDVTGNVKSLVLKEINTKASNYSMSERILCLSGNGTENLLMRTVCSDESKRLSCGSYSADLTTIPTVKNNEQLHSLARAVRFVLSAEGVISKDLCGLSSDLVAKLFKEIAREQLDSEPVYRGWWFDEVRSEDIMMCFNRLRGLDFKDRA